MKLCKTLVLISALDGGLGTIIYTTCGEPLPALWGIAIANILLSCTWWIMPLSWLEWLGEPIWKPKIGD